MGFYIDTDGELRSESEDETAYAGGSKNFDETTGTYTNPIYAGEVPVDSGETPRMPDFAGGESQDHDFTKEEAEQLWKAGVWDQVKGLGKQALNLFKTNGEYDIKKLIAMGGGLLAANKSNAGPAPTGYQGKIPKLTATSNMLTAPPVGRRPGSGGINYGGGTTYRNEKGEVVSSNEKTLAELRAAAESNPFNRPSTYENPSYGRPPVTPPSGGGLPDIVRPPAPGPAPGTTTPTAPVVDGGTVVGGGIPGRGQDTRPTVSGGTTAQGYSRNYLPAEIQAIRAGFLENRQDPQKMMELMKQYSVSVNDIATAMGGDLQGYQNIFLKAGADNSFGGMSDYKPTANDKAYIDRMLTQPNPMQQGTLGDMYKKQGIDPYTDPRVISQARGQNTNAANRATMYGGMANAPMDQIAPWQDPNWRAKQDAAEKAERERQRIFREIDAKSGVTVGGGIAAPDVNDWAKTQQGQAAGGINSVYDSINTFLATNPSQQALSSAMQDFGVNLSTLDAARAYAPPANPEPVVVAPGPAPETVVGPGPAPVVSPGPAPETVVGPGPAPEPTYTAPNPLDPYDSYYFTGAAKGGLVRDGFVVPADVVSHFGNGSSEAGLKLLASKIGATPIKGDGDGMSDSIKTNIDGVQEARVANDEAYVSPEMVKKLGNGSPEKGARKLYAMMDKIRKARTGSTEQGKEIDPDKFMPGGSVQRYDVGGTTTRTVPTGATGSESSLSNWAGDYVTNMLGQGAAQANKPYEAYTGPLTAGASGLQNQAFNMAGNLQTPGSIGQAAGTAGGIANLAANMRYTPQTTDFLGGANMSGLGVAPSYGMGMPQQQPMGTYNNPIPMPRSSREYGGSHYDPTTGYESRDLVKLQPGDPRLESTNFQTKPFREPPTGGTTPLPFESGAPEMPQYGQPIQTGSRPGLRDMVTMDPSNPMYDTMYNYMKQGREQSMAGRPSESFQTKPFRGESSEPFMQDGAMTGGVMSPPGQEAGLPNLMRGVQGNQPQASQPVGNIAQQYMNPYLESALRPQMAEMQRAADIARLQDAGRLTQAGAYGGSRQAIMESEGRRNLLSKQSEALGQGYATAYDKAMQQFNADQARRAQEAQFGASFGLQGLQTGLQGAQTQAQAGALQSQADLSNLRGTLEAGGIQRGIESEGIAADKAQFEEARLNPYKMVQFQQSLLSGLPLSAQSYSIPGQSNLQQFAGGATTVQQLLDILSGKKAAATK